MILEVITLQCGVRKGNQNKNIQILLTNWKL
jgi:hypothetical protein